MNYDKLIKEKTEKLNSLLQQAGQHQQRAQQLNNEALKVDGAITQLNELQDESKPKPESKPEPPEPKK